MRFVYLLIVLGFPLLDLFATLRIARWTGVPMGVWIALPLVAGFLLLRNERLAFRTRTIAALHGEHSALRDLFDSGRKVLAAFLLILPGVISDVFALTLLALPLNVGHRAYAMRTAAAHARGERRSTIEGEYRRLP